MAKGKKAPLYPICGYCGENVISGARGCGICQRRVAGFKRLCPFCEREVPLKANTCPHCGKVFPLSQGSFFHVRCRGCKKGWELDDLMAALNCPLLFKTERGVKLRWFASAEAAVRAWLRYFRPRRRSYTEEEARAYLAQGDEDPWHFSSGQAAISFLESFICNTCRTASWELYRGAGPTLKMAAKALPFFVVAGAAITKATKRFFQDVAEDVKVGNRRRS